MPWNFQEIFNNIKCVFNKHISGNESSCPYTMMTYIKCINCDQIISARKSGF